ncbi:hypothetical protein ACQCN2_20225 [Brevibacillus ginsengisoli]|uniref:hypothetical protein n=1 Tax=Brevibacillus ginsengisoli TaxID=363854 RepID=UPI003CEF5976
MQKICSHCGCEMSIMLRNVVYRSRVKIQNVPVYACLNEECAHSQVVETVKKELKQLMEDLGTLPLRQEIDFNSLSEFSNVLVAVADKYEEIDVKDVIEERINELLDIFLLAQSLGDHNWMNDTRRRLHQVIL